MSPADNLRIGAIIAAGGTGSRFGSPEGKQLAEIAGKPVVVWSLEAVAASAGITDVAVVCHPDRVLQFEAALRGATLPAGIALTVVAGGDTRQASVAAGLAEIPDACDVVVVHDGARPLADSALCEHAIACLLADPDAEGAAVGHPSVDTLKHVSEGRIVATPDRTFFWAIQTPQVFHGFALRRAYESAEAEGYLGTDDSSLVERLGGRVLAVEGPRENLKVTHAEDLAVAEALLTARLSTGPEGA